MKIVSTKAIRTYPLGAMDETGRYFKVDSAKLRTFVTNWINDNEVAKTVKGLSASYIPFEKLGRYCVLSRLAVADDAAEKHFADDGNSRSWLAKRTQVSLCDLLVDELDRALPKEFFRIASSKAGTAGSAGAATASMTSKSSASKSDFLSDDLQPVPSAFLAELDIPFIGNPANEIEAYMAASYNALADTIVCRAGNTDQQLRAALVATYPLIKKQSEKGAAKQYSVRCIWIPDKIAMAYQPAKPSATVLLFAANETPGTITVKSTKPQAYHFMGKDDLAWAFLLTLPEAGQGLGQGRSDSVKEMNHVWIGPYSLGYALGFDMNARLDNVTSALAIQQRAERVTEKGVEPERWYAAALPLSGTTSVTSVGQVPQIPRTPAPASMDSEIVYYKKANLGPQAKKNYPTETLPIERAADAMTAKRPMLILPAFTRWFKRQGLLVVKTKKKKYLTPNFNPSARKDAAGVMYDHLRTLVGGNNFERIFGADFKGSATEVTEATFKLLVTPYIKDDASATTAAAAAADATAAPPTAANTTTSTPAAANTAAAAPAAADTATAANKVTANKPTADAKSSDGRPAKRARTGRRNAAATIAAVWSDQATTPAARYWSERSLFLRRTDGATAKANQIGVLRTDQEWCHLLGHGDKGEEKPDNFVAGSKHCNTEQLAIEEGHRITRGTLEVRITAYLLPQEARVFNQSVKNPDDWQSLLTKGKAAYAAARDAKSGSEKATQQLDDFLTKVFVPGFPATMQSAIAEKYNKTPADRKLEYFESLLETIDASLYIYFPVAAFMRYKIYFGKTKLFDHVFDAQKESFDYNEFQIVRTTVSRLVSVALRAAAPAPPVAATALTPPTAPPPAPVDYEDVINQAIAERMKREILDLIEKDPTLTTEQVAKIFTYDAQTIKNFKGKSGRASIATLREFADASYKRSLSMPTPTLDDQNNMKLVRDTLTALNLIEAYRLPGAKAKADVIALPPGGKRKGAKEDTAAEANTLATPAAAAAAAAAKLL